MEYMKERLSALILGSPDTKFNSYRDIQNASYNFVLENSVLGVTTTLRVSMFELSTKDFDMPTFSHKMLRLACDSLADEFIKKLIEENDIKKRIEENAQSGK